jgi:hypothetical protein
MSSVPDDDSPATKQDIRLLKEDVHVVKEDIRLVKEDVHVVKEDIRLLKEDVYVVKEDIHLVKEDVHLLRSEVKQDLTAMEDRLVEKMRDMQTELLRGFAAFSEAQTIRLRKVEADQSNLDAALSGRVAVIEKRLLEIELRLGRA